MDNDDMNWWNEESKRKREMSTLPIEAPQSIKLSYTHSTTTEYHFRFTNNNSLNVQLKYM